MCSFCHQRHTAMCSVKFNASQHSWLLVEPAHRASAVYEAKLSAKRPLTLSSAAESRIAGAILA